MPPPGLQQIARNWEIYRQNRRVPTKQTRACTLPSRLVVVIQGFTRTVEDSVSPRHDQKIHTGFWVLRNLCQYSYLRTIAKAPGVLSSAAALLYLVRGTQVHYRSNCTAQQTCWRTAQKPPPGDERQRQHLGACPWSLEPQGQAALCSFDICQVKNISDSRTTHRRSAHFRGRPFVPSRQDARESAGLLGGRNCGGTCGVLRSWRGRAGALRIAGQGTGAAGCS